MHRPRKTRIQICPSDMKECFKCSRTLPLSEFYRHPNMGDGYLGKCKECTKSDVRANRRRKSDYYAEYDRKRGNRWRDGYEKEYRRRYPERYKAQTAVNNAIRDGRLRKEPCFICGDENVVGHHPDYSKPLDVVWLCQKCHKRIHAYEDKVNEIKAA